MCMGELRHIEIAQECEDQSQRPKVSLKNFNHSSDIVTFVFQKDISDSSLEGSLE